MKKENQSPIISIEYKNDEKARNKLVHFLINLLIEENNSIGDLLNEQNQSDRGCDNN
ncbi:hypothetical protein OW763_02650 [Clostridium aestuarii]|uniref:Uncharacterized protein n=1 Tax=Clostridium aestuarii TaxID=338193 RepID=A0ABT4CW90_9CLOT|nr:hypothetical protein [Clostridium aestuarii]MCY6483254.1 hypothetical protein [Clostridium aestuarii]